MFHRLIPIVIILLLPLGSTLADEATEKKITFDEHIKPIFREHCTSCHSESDKESDLALDSFGGAMAGGSSGAVIAEGNTGGSRLFALMTHAERPFMPPDQDVIAKEQLALVKTWIEQGMPENSGSKIKRNNGAAASMLSTTSLGKPEGPPPMPENLLRQPVIETTRSSAISAMAASPWAPLIVVGGQEQVCCYHAESGELLGVIPFPEGEPQSLTFTRDGKQLLIGGGRHSHSGCAVLVDIASGNRIAKVGDELDIVLAADISPDKKRIAIAGPQKIVRVFDTFSGEMVVEMKKHTDWIFALRYSPDGVLLATGDRSNGLIVWEADTGRLYSELVGHKGEVRGLDFRSDSNVLASASLDGTIKLWDMIESKEIKSWTAHANGVSSVVYDNNGLLASAGQDARVKLWNGNGDLQKEFAGLGEAALEVALTGDGSVVAGGDWYGKVQVWPAIDPKQTKLIVANPPSIHKRLEAALAALTAARAEFNSADQAAMAASTIAEKSNADLAAAKNSAESLNSLMGKTTAQNEALTVKLKQQDTLVQQLEAQLAAAKQERQTLAHNIEKAVAQIADLTKQSTAATMTLKTAEALYREQADAAKLAADQRAAVATRLANAQALVDAAAADKAALDARAEALQKLTQNTASTVKTLVQEVNVAVDQQTAQQLAVEKLTTQLQALTDQLSVLQLRAEEAKAGRAEAEQTLEAQVAQAAELKQQLEVAEQAALEAQAELKLFQAAYGTLN